MTWLAGLAAIVHKPDVAIFHRFHRPPYGGGNQCLLALRGEFERRGLRVGDNVIARSTRACLFNSFNFDFDRLRRSRRATCRMVHRVDGPIQIYRGRDDGTDERIWRINRELAVATIFQSEYSLRRHLELGLEFQAPAVVRNAADPAIFHPAGRVAFDRRRHVRLITTSWSDNPNKGAHVYKWVEDHLDWDRFEYTFVGRSPIAFDRIRTVAPVPSSEVADYLRRHDVFLFASQNEACSNALLEALSCGLPAIYLRSGSNAELVGDAGFGFDAAEEIPGLLQRLVDDYERRQSAIAVPSLADVASRYLAVLLPEQAD